VPTLDASNLRTALQRVGELLAAEGQAYAITLVGGAALALGGWVTRTTEDADILTFAEREGDRLVETPDPLPAPLVRAAELVARDGGMAPGWLNRGPAAQWRSGLPPGFGERITWHQFAALRVGLPHRRDLIALKLFAEVDRGGGTGRGVDLSDLRQLRPTDEELEWAAAWVKGQDAGPEFAANVDKVVHDVRTVRR
jgi:hypothetical protein